ncbi:MAG: hypothetical protein AAAB13_20680 [Pseudomonas sp.]
MSIKRDLVDRLRDEAVRVAIERAGAAGNLGISTRDVTGSVISEAADHIVALETQRNWMLDQRLKADRHSDLSMATPTIDEEIVGYVSRYGGMCRDCADEFGVCPHSGVPCDTDQRRAVIRKTIEALRYGIKHNFIPNIFGGAAMTTTTTPSSEGGDGWQDIASAPKDGTIILCYGDVAGEFNGIYAAKMIFPCQFWGKSDYSGFEWIVPETDYAAMWMNPSHWQFLQKPPSEIKP